MGDCLMATVRTMPSLPIPPESYEARRNQYYSTKILKEMLGEVPENALKLLGVTDKDLCIPILTYVFGEAQVGGRPPSSPSPGCGRSITDWRRTSRCSWRGFARKASTSWGTRSASFIARRGSA